MITLKEKFIEIIERQVKEYAKVDLKLEEIPESTNLSDLQIDSLTYLEAINELEDAIDANLPFNSNDALNVVTVGDLLNLIDDLDKKHSSSNG